MGSKRTDADAIERRLLDLAFTTDVKITAASLAYFAPCAIDDAAQVLEGLAARDRVRMEVEDDGTVVYQVAGRQKLGTPAPVELPRAQLVPQQQARHVSPILAVLLTIALPGAGHLYAGRIAAAMLWFLVVSIGYLLILPGLLFHAFAIMSAASAAHRVSAPRPLFLAA